MKSESLYAYPGKGSGSEKTWEDLRFTCHANPWQILRRPPTTINKNCKPWGESRIDAVQGPVGLPDMEVFLSPISCRQDFSLYDLWAPKSRFEQLLIEGGDSQETTWGRIKGTREVKVAQSCPTLCDPMDRMVHGILQARVLFPFSSRSSLPRNRTGVSCIAGRF